MKQLFLTIPVVLAMGFAACTSKSNQPTDEPAQQTIKPKSTMKNLVSIIEIPATDLGRAIQFYNSILGIKIEEADMGGVKMGILPNEEGTLNVVLAKGSDYTPAPNGNVLYLNAGDNLQAVLDKIEPNGGKVIVPKTEISPEMGFFALFIDPEGNKLGLHSPN